MNIPEWNRGFQTSKHLCKSDFYFFFKLTGILLWFCEDLSCHFIPTLLWGILGADSLGRFTICSCEISDSFSSLSLWIGWFAFLHIFFFFFNKLKLKLYLQPQPGEFRNERSSYPGFWQAEQSLLLLCDGKWWTQNVLSCRKGGLSSGESLPLSSL